MISIGTFDNFNIAVAGVKGSIAPAAAMINETLMTRSQDEIATEYGLLAERAAHPDDFAWVIYRLRKEARWHDGKPVTPEDVIFSIEVLKKNSPLYASYYRHVAKAEKTGERDIKFTFDSPGNRELPTIVGELPVLPKHYWEGTDAAGRKRDISATTLETPLGSGPYRIKEFVAGRSVKLERVKDYWGANLPTQIGQNNFDEMRFEFFRDNLVALEAFKADQADWIAENSAKQWATAYDFPAVAEKRVVKEEFPINDSGRMQGFVLNLRRDQFKDARLRRAFNYAFDFEEMNKQLFYGQYKRINSYFDGTELASSGLPEGQELQILETVRGQGAGRSLHDALFQSGRRQSGSGARQFARGHEAFEGGGLTRCATRSWWMPRASRSPSKFWFRIRPRNGSRCSTSRHWNASASPLRSASSTMRNIRTGCAASISISSSINGESRCRPATSSGNSGDRRPRTNPAQETPSASRIRLSMC